MLTRLIQRRIAILLPLALLALTAAAQTGTPVPALAALDNIMQQALARYSVKGGALAIVKDGHLLFARGYGWADAEAQQPVQPDSLFRWCSMSKTVTAAAVMLLVEEGKLDLDTPLGPESEDLALVLYCTGVRGRSAIQGVTVSLGRTKAVAFYAGPQMEYPGLDQINAILPRSLAGAGEIPVTVDVDGSSSNAVSLVFR